MNGGMKVHRVVDHPSGDGSKVHQVATVMPHKGGKLMLQVHGLAAVGADAKPKTFRNREALEKAGWQEGH